MRRLWSSRNFPPSSGARRNARWRSRIPGLPEVLGQRLGVRVERANPIQNLKVREGVFETLAMDEIVPLLMLPVGLALRAA